jgi:cyclopropane fatty-acyl-phospholipid synthase-like methyltransferase
MGKRPRNEWEEFFDAHAPIYMENPFTKDTVKEVDFLLEELGLPAGSCILDIGCGTGRHAVELAGRGYRLTGVDISSGMLDEARRTAEKAGVELTWIHADATEVELGAAFDAAICLCEGAFGLIGKGGDPIEHTLSILRRAHAALKPDAPLVLTCISAFGVIRRQTKQDVDKGLFDPLTMAQLYEMDYQTKVGKKIVMMRERSYTPTELRLLFELAGFEVRHIWGGTAGNWGRRPIDLDEIEIMVVARKSGG